MKSQKPVNYPDPVVYDNERLIFARFDGPNGFALNTPIFFSNSDVLTNKIITGIDVKYDYIDDGNTQFVQTDIGFVGTLGVTSFLSYFTITLVGKNGDILLNDYPLSNFCKIFNYGKIRRTSMNIDLSKSYLRNFGATIPSNKFVIPINFFYKNK
jgi:hypothetical protein